MKHLIFLVLLLVGCNEPYEIVKSGVYDHATYTDDEHGSFGTYDPGSTIIHFEDGTTFVVWGRRNMTHKTGTCIDIWAAPRNRSSHIQECGEEFGGYQ